MKNPFSAEEKQPKGKEEQKRRKENPGGQLKTTPVFGNLFFKSNGVVGKYITVATMAVK